MIVVGSYFIVATMWNIQLWWWMMPLGISLFIVGIITHKDKNDNRSVGHTDIEKVL